MRILERSGEFYEIVGDNLEMLRIQVEPGQQVFAEAGKMVYLRGDLKMSTGMPGEGVLGKLLGAGKRLLAGESLFFTYYEGKGEVGFAGDFPGRILPVALEGRALVAQRDAFIAALGEVEVSVAFHRRIGGMLFGGEGLVLEKISGSGLAFIHAGGDLVSFHLAPGEVLKVDTGSAVVWEEGVDFSVGLVGGVKTALFGGEGLFLTTLTGPGMVIVQTMNLAKLRREILGGLEVRTR